MCSRLLLGSPPITYNNATHMPTDSPPGKPFFLLFLELHSKELHCLVNYFKCFISVQRFENLHWSWFSALRICPCFIQMVFLFNLTQLHCELRNSISSLWTLFSFSQSSNYTLWLWLHTFSESLCHQHHSTQKLYSDRHIGHHPLCLFAEIMVSSLQLQLAFLKPFWAFSH